MPEIYFLGTQAGNYLKGLWFSEVSRNMSDSQQQCSDIDAPVRSLGGRTVPDGAVGINQQS